MNTSLADTFLREAFFAPDRTIRIARSNPFAPSAQAVRDLLGRGLFVEVGRRMDLQGTVLMLYRLTDEGVSTARTLTLVK